MRYFNVYGPRQDPEGPYAAVIPGSSGPISPGEAPVIYGDGEQSRDFTFVADVVAANLLAAVWLRRRPRPRLQHRMRATDERQRARGAGARSWWAAGPRPR